MSCWTHPLFLMTKTLLEERKRRIHHTIWEIISGVLVFVVLILMRQLVKHTGEDFELIGRIVEDRLDYVVYYPKTSLTDDFMPIVIRKLSTKRRLYITGFYTIQEMHRHLRMNNNKTKAVVYFRVFNKTIPHLDYTIGLIDDHSQYRRHFMKIFTVDPINAEQHATLPLMQLQWAIDNSFMQYATGHTIKHKVSFPEYRKLDLRPKHWLDVIYNFLIFCTMIAPLPYYLYNHSRLVLERRSGLKELMRIMGVTPNVLRCSHYLDSVLLSVINSILITTMLKITNTPILPLSNFFIIVFTIMLYFLTITSLAFVTSVVGQEYEHSNGLALVMYIIACALCIFWYIKLHMGTIPMYLGCFLLPHAPIYLFWNEVKYMECANVGLNFNNIAKQHPSIYTVIPVAYAWLAFIVQLIVVWIIVWYLDVVIPGSYGVAQSKNFLFRKDYWRPRKKVHYHVTSERSKLLHDRRFFQKPPSLPVAIKLVHVSKLEVTQYRSVKFVNHVLNEINLDIYKGEVTVVLGVEGSGKTTVVSLITGMTKPTVGKIYVNGYETTMFLRTIQKTLGFCPQKHLTFAYLTVEENITLFEQLRGVQKEDQTSTTEELMNKLRLKGKADVFSYQLTPSAERCLQVACALAGGADILILDEPTSNCDSETRHYLWDIIMELRGLKTIVMTTSSIEEADAVGDRIALFSKGKIKCHGTPKFLKNAIGTGFNLSVTLKNVEGADAVRALVESTLHGTVTTNLDSRRLLFTLPAKDHELFPDLFDALEQQKVELGIANMGVGMSLEEIFLGFIEDTIQDAVFVETYHGYPQLKDWRLRFQQIGVLMKRNFEYMWSYKCQFTILQIIIPVLGLIVISVTTNSYRQEHGDSKTITLLIDPGERRSNNIEAIRDMYPELHVFRTHGHADITDRKKKTVLWPDKNVIKFVMRPNKSDLYVGLHSLPEATKALNTFSNIYMSDVVPQRKPAVIALSAKKINLFIPKETIMCMFWAIGVTFFAAIPLIKFIELLIYEHRYLVRYTHRAVGSSNFIHWIAKLFAQMTLFLIVIPPAVILCAYNLDTEETLTQGDFLGAMYLALLLFLPAFLLQLYGLSFILENEFAVSQIYIQSIALCFSGPVIQRLLVDLSSSTSMYTFPLEFLNVIGRLCPVFTLSEIITCYTTVARAKSFCSHNVHYCKGLDLTDSKAKILDEICCDPNRKQYNYFSGAPLTLLLTLMCHIICYGFLLVLLQKKRIHILCERLVNVNYSEQKITKKDQNVIKETAEVDRMMHCVKHPKNCVGERPPDDTLLVHNLHKRFCYCGVMRGRITNVKGVSFKVNAGDSLVLLGPHSSGKTTVLYMMTGTTAPTRGDCYIGGTSLQDQRSKFIDKLALSIGGLDKFSTGYINLKRLCMLHGLRSGDAALFTVTCMTYMGLEALMHVPVQAYNPGCRRRLGLCVALLSAPPVVLVDEVMQQLEPHTRPLVRRALSSLRSRGCAIVMSEHSVAWRDLDSLDTRIGVMNEGHLISLGSIEHVRKLLADGHMARLKLKRKAVPKFGDSNEELTEGEIDKHLKFQSKRKHATVGLNVEESDDSVISINKDKPKGQRKKKASRDSSAAKSASGSKEAPDTEYMDAHSKLAKAKVDVAASHYRKSSKTKLLTIDEDDSSDSIQVEVRQIPDEENVKPDDNGKNEKIPEKKDEVERSQTTEEEKKEKTESFQTTQEKKIKGMPDQKEEAGSSRERDKAGSSGETDKTSVPSKKDEADNVQSTEEGKNKTASNQKEEAGSSRERDKAGSSGETDKTSVPSKKDEADNVQSTEEGKNKTASNQKEEAGSSRERDQAGSSGETDKTSVPSKKDEADNVQSTEEGKNKTTSDQKDKVVDQNQQLGVQNIPAAEKPGDTDKSTTASKKTSQNEDQTGRSGETDRAATLADKSAKEEEKDSNSDDDIYLAYENLIEVEESQNFFEFKPSQTVADLKKDFKIAFPTSHLAEEHLSMLYFYIKGESDGNKMPYSTMFSKLERLKSVYKDLIEDYTLSEISIEDVYCHLETESTGYKQIRFDTY